MLVIRGATKRDYPEILKIMNGAVNGKELRGFVPPPEITEKFVDNLRTQLELKEHGVAYCELGHGASRICVFHSRK